MKVILRVSICFIMRVPDEGYFESCFYLFLL